MIYFFKRLLRPLYRDDSIKRVSAFSINETKTLYLIEETMKAV